MVYVSLSVLIFLAFLNIIIFDVDFVSTSVDYKVYDPSDFGTKTKNVSFNIDDAKYGMSFLIAIITATTLMGLQILGSGLNDTVVRNATLIIMYVAIWTVLSVLSWELLMSNVVVGSIIFLILTMLYMIGVSSKLAGGD